MNDSLFVAAYADSLGRAIEPAMDAINTILAFSEAFKRGYES